MELRWTVPTREDDGALIDLLGSMEEVDHRGEVWSPADIDDEWASVWSHPEQDARFGWDGGDLVGFAWLKAMPGEREANKVGCWGGVRPSHRRRGLGTELLEWSLARAGAIATRFDTGLPTKAELDAPDGQRDLLAIAAACGFERVRRFLEVARRTSVPVPPAPAPSGLEGVPWSEALDEEARFAHRESFADHWGSEPRSKDEWRQWYTGHRSFRPDLSRLAVDPASGRVEALVLSSTYPPDWERGPVEAWIQVVGTRRASRGKGVARWLLSDVLQRIAEADTGFERAILGVDAENPTGALGLYRSLGFEDVRSVHTLTCPV